MNLVGIQFGTFQRFCQGSGLHTGTGLFGAEHRIHRQQAHAPQPSAALTAGGVIQPAAQHLIAAADAQHRRAPGRQLLDGRFQTILPQPQQVCHGALGAGENHKIRLTQLHRRLHIADAQSRVAFQGGKIREVGNAGQTDHCDVNGFGRFLLLHPGRQGVLVVQVHLQIGNHTQHRNPGFLLQHGKAGTQKCRIATKFVDQQAFDPPLLLRLQ